MVCSETSHSCDHILLLHPFGIDRAALGFTLFSRFKYRLMLVESLPAVAMVLTGESCAPSFAVSTSQTLSRAIGVVLLAGMLAQAFEILRPKHRDIVEHFAATALGSAIDLSASDIVEKVLFVSVTTEALTRRTDGLAIDAVSVSPVDIQPVLPRLSHIRFKLFKLLF